MGTPLQILGLSGSLRKKSFNSAALRAARQLLPDGMAIEIFDLAPIPMYNEDVREQGFPEPVQQLRDKIAAADALLIVSPEYNYSIPGPLKNAIDWVSRPPNQPFDGKPIAIMGASPGSLGTARAQYHLRQVFVYLNGMILNRPEVMIAAAHTRFDEQGNLTDGATSEHIQKMLIALAEWTHRLRQGEMSGAGK
jgi:chromate reductase